MEEWERQVLRAQTQRLKEITAARDAAIDAIQKAMDDMEDGIRLLKETIENAPAPDPRPNGD